MLHISKELANAADLAVAKCDIDNALMYQQLSNSNEKQVFEFPEGIVFLYKSIAGRNRTLRFGLQAEITPEFLDKVEYLYQTNNSPSRIILNPYADINFASTLSQRGYYIIAFMQVLVADLSGSVSSIKLSDEFNIRPVINNEQQLWAETMAAGFACFGIPYLTNPEMHINTPKLENSICYFAEHGNTIAGVSSVIFQDEWAYLFTASTVEEFRCNGLQTALINRRLLEAKNCGCRYAVIVVRPGSSSMRNAEKNGFQVAYSRAFLQKDFPGIISENVC